MVQLGSVCLRRVARGRATLEIRFGRLLRNAKVTVERLVAGWGEETARCVAGRHVLALQDTSELNFRTKQGRRRGLGLIGKGSGRGVLLHPMLAVDAASGECLGLVGGTLWSREEPPADDAADPGKERKKKDNKSRPLGEKESRHWVETAEAAKGVLATAAMVTAIADQEADFYQLWALVPGPNMHVLGRAYHDRKLLAGGTLSTAARSWPVLATRCITIRERENRPERSAMLALRLGLVTIPRPPDAREAGLPDQVSLTLIELSEPNPPAGAEPVQWRLLTTHTPFDAEAAWQIVDWYRARWTIEQFFRILKTQGFQIEDSQLETAERLLKLVAIAARAAVIVLQLTQARDAKNSLPATLVFAPEELATLDAVNRSYTSPKQSRCNPHPNRSLAWACWIIARLGGWNAQPSSKPPGPITLKHGLDILQPMARGWALRDVYTP